MELFYLYLSEVGVLSAIAIREALVLVFYS
jgi:hypothetical protein